MTPQKQSRSSALFLTELTLAILFFAAASAVCVQIFVKSHLAEPPFPAVEPGGQ